MAKFTLELPTDILEDVKKIYDNADEIIGEMVKAGAKVVKQTMKANLPEGIKNSRMRKRLKGTKVYFTPSDDGINCKVGFFGYFKDKDGRKKPAPLVANVFEYGRSEPDFPKQPFLRPAFNQKAKIEKAMQEAQKKASGGLLKNE